jgi:hypothetical protein
MDQLMEANIISSKVEEEDSIMWLNGRMTESNDEEKTWCQKHHAPKDAMIDEE